MSRMPFGMRPPSAAKRAGSFRKSTISRTSAFASSTPATSEKVICCPPGSAWRVSPSIDGRRPPLSR